MKKAIAWMLLLLFAVYATARAQGRYVRPGDAVTVNCDQEQAISKDYTITQDGFIIMQYVGAVPVAGLTETDAGNRIATALVSQHILSQASVSLQVDSSKQGVITYSGAVGASGNLPPAEGLRLSDVVKTAQPNAQADMQNVRIVTAAGHQFIVNFAAFDGKNKINNPLVLSGDSVFFDPLSKAAPSIQPAPSTVQGGAPTIQAPSRPHTQIVQPISQPGYSRAPDQPYQQGPDEGGDRFIEVTGAVENPTHVHFHRGLSLTEAIHEAGGMLRDSDTSQVTIRRKVDGQVRTFKENYGDIDKGFAGDIELRDHDHIDVPFKSRGSGKVVRYGALVILALILLH